MCFCRRSVMDLCRPGILRTPTPHPVAVCDFEGLAACLATGGGFQVLLTARPRSLLIARMAAVQVGYMRADSESPDSL